MAYNIWRGDSQPIAQVTTFTVAGTLATGNTISVTINRKVITYTLVALESAGTAAAALYALCAASSLPEFAALTWSYLATSSLFTATGNATTGAPFVATASATGGGATLTAATPTTGTGPNDYDNAANWSLNSAPTGSDNTVIAGGPALLYGAGSIAGATIEVRGGFNNGIGLPERNPAGYYEYLTRYVTLNSAVVKIGEGDGGGPAGVFVKGVASSTWTVYSTGQRNDPAFPSCDIDWTGNPTLVNISGGDVGLCVFNEATARTVATLGLSSGDGTVTVGRLVTVTAFDLDDGTAAVWGTMTAVTMGAGKYTQEDGTLTAITAYGGVATLKHTGTVTSAIFRAGASAGAPICDCTANNLARTFTNAEFTGGAAFKDPNKTVTHTNPYVTDNASYLASDIGPRFSIQRS